MPFKSKLTALLLMTGLLLTYGSVAAMAATDTRQLTLQQAVDMAMTSSGTLKLANYSIDQAEDRHDAASVDVDYTPEGQTTDENEKAFNNLVSADISLQQSKRSYQSSLDSVSMSVYQAYFNILQDQVSLDAARQALALAELQQRAASLNLQLGGASKLEAQQASDACASSRASLATSGTTLADAYQKFNQLVGLMPDDRPVLVDQPSFAPLAIDSLDAEISRVLASSPSVLQKRDAVDQAKIALTIYSYGPTETNTYEATEKNIDIAEQNLSMSKDSAAQSLRTLYYNIQKLESDHDNLQQKLATAELNLKIAQVKYDTGAASAIDLATAQSSLTAARQSLLSNACQHQLQAMSFETPWAGASS